MTRYVALLRGINVGSARRLAMHDLRAIVEAAGFTDPRTILNSGNVVFAGTGTVAEVAGRLEAGIVAQAGFRSRVFVETRESLDVIVSENALLPRMTNPSRLQVAFVDDPQVLAGLTDVARRTWGDEALAVGTRAAYLWCPEGVARGEVAQAAGLVLADHTTLRAWSTVLKLQAWLRAGPST